MLISNLAKYLIYDTFKSNISERERERETEREKKREREREREREIGVDSGLFPKITLIFLTCNVKITFNFSNITLMYIICNLPKLNESLKSQIAQHYFLSIPPFR